jgi:hypothetical protein
VIAYFFFFLGAISSLLDNQLLINCEIRDAVHEFHYDVLKTFSLPLAAALNPISVSSFIVCVCVCVNEVDVGDTLCLPIVHFCSSISI